MLLAVEGGGFFSSSASGYSNGLALLLLGRRNEESPRRVSPWNQYHLVELDSGPHPPASERNQASCRCTSFICFSCASEAIEPGSGHQYETSSKGIRNDSVDETKRKLCLKSSLKKHFTEVSVSVESDDARDSLEEMQSNISCCTQRRKIRWTDACGGELAEIREFETSEEFPSDEDTECGEARRCECVIQ